MKAEKTPRSTRLSSAAVSMVLVLSGCNGAGSSAVQVSPRESSRDSSSTMFDDLEARGDALYAEGLLAVQDGDTEVAIAKLAMMYAEGAYGSLRLTDATQAAAASYTLLNNQIMDSLYCQGAQVVSTNSGEAKATLARMSSIRNQSLLGTYSDMFDRNGDGKSGNAYEELKDSLDNELSPKTSRPFCEVVFPKIVYAPYPNRKASP